MKARDPEGVHAGTRSARAADRAHGRLVNDLLDVSRLARGKVQLDRRRFELREAVERAVDMAGRQSLSTAIRWMSPFPRAAWPSMATSIGSSRFCRTC